MTGILTGFTCPSCRIRYDVRAALGDPPMSLDLGPEREAKQRWRALRAFAAEFDAAAAGEHYTVSEFLDFLEPSVLGSERHRATTTLTSVHAWIARDGGEAA